MNTYQICTRCVMDTTDPGISFDEHGHCSFCNGYLAERGTQAPSQKEELQQLETMVAAMKRRGRRKRYDAILGLSGGVDSSYLLYLAHQLGLRVLALHVDTGWNSEVAVRNIERICTKLHIQLHTIVMDWPSIKELQRAYLLSGVANLDVPQDHAFMSCLRKYARKHGIHYLLSGANHATEGSGSPFSQQKSYMDSKHMRSIYAAHGQKKSLRKYPMMSLPQAAWMHLTVHTVKLLDMLPYSKKDAIALLAREFEWEYYGGKHFESRFTKYFQSVYLPVKYSYDKRRHHLSCALLNGELTREDALAELSNPPCSQETAAEDEVYILKKLDITPEQWRQVLTSPPTPNDSYASYGQWVQLGKRVLQKWHYLFMG